MGMQLQRLRCTNGSGLLCAAFGAGLLIASCCPCSVLVFLIAALLILLGFSLRRF